MLTLPQIKKIQKMEAGFGTFVAHQNKKVVHVCLPDNAPIPPRGQIRETAHQYRNGKVVTVTHETKYGLLQS